MLGLDPEIGTSALRLWVAAGSAALLIGFAVFASFWPPSGRIRAGLVLLGALLGAGMTWACLDRATWGDRSAERQVVEWRAAELSARALAPGSPLACLDALAGESVEAACEKTLFVSPASVASASSYVAAQLTLLADMAAYGQKRDGNIENALLPLRRSLEADRFGFVAHVLAIRDGCTSQNCKALGLLHDASRVRAHLSEATLDRYVEHYQEIWAKPPEGTLAEGGPPPPAPGPRKMVNIDFPSSASIPPVSIMNPEPTGPVLPGVAAAAAANPNGGQAATPPRHARKQTANPPPQTHSPPVAAGPAATEPIWPEPVPPAPMPSQTAAAPAGAPVQLAPPPSASVGSATVRTQ
jgi:hypothetical protein